MGASSAAAARAARVERVAQAVADEVDRQDGDGDRRAGGDPQPGLSASRIPTSIAAVEHLTPQLASGGWTPRPRKLQAGLGDDRVGDAEARQRR